MGSYTVYSNVLGTRKVGRAFKLVNDSLNLKVLVCWAKICKQSHSGPLSKGQPH